MLSEVTLIRNNIQANVFVTRIYEYIPGFEGELVLELGFVEMSSANHVEHM